MLSFLRTRGRDLIGGFWFLPLAVVVALALLAVLALVLDHAAGTEGVEIFFGGDASAARGILTAIAGSFITVAGLAFSLTIVTLQLVSSQFTPRALRIFTEDRLMQLTAGAFVGIVVYSFIVLRSVRNPEEVGGDGGFVPGLSVSLAITLAFGGLLLVLFFIHHLSSSIQLSSISWRVASLTLDSIDQLYPDPVGEPQGRTAADAADAWRRESGPGLTVAPTRAGYVQAIDLEGLAEAFDDGARVYLASAPGDFVTEEDTLAEVWPASIDRERAEEAVQRSVNVANERSPAQDTAYGLRQLADIGVRALSPGVNDPTTATTAIGYLRACLERLAKRELPAGERAIGGVTVAARSRGYSEFLRTAFAEMTHYAEDDERVSHALRVALERVADAAGRAGATERRDLVREVAERGFPPPGAE